MADSNFMPVYQFKLSEALNNSRFDILIDGHEDDNDSNL